MFWFGFVCFWFSMWCYVCFVIGFIKLYYIMCYCYLLGYFIIEFFIVLSIDLNLFYRRDDGYLVVKYELDMEIYLFDLCKFFFVWCIWLSILSLDYVWFFSLFDVFVLFLLFLIEFKVFFVWNILLILKCNWKLRFKILMFFSC